MSLNTKLLAKQFDELSELIMAISGTFRDAGSAGGTEGDDDTPAKPVRGAGKSAAAKPAAKKASKAAELTEDDMREALEALSDAKGKDALIEALSHVGAGKFSEVDEADWPELKTKVDELMAADDDLGDDDTDKTPKAKKAAAAKPAAKKAAAKKKALSLEDDVQPKFAELVEADRSAAVKLLKKHGAAKLSELDEDTFADFLADVEEALEADGGDDSLM